jgi:hypothetical protein
VCSSAAGAKGIEILTDQQRLIQEWNEAVPSVPFEDWPTGLPKQYGNPQVREDWP